jgi:hypothetical protein
VGNVVTQSITNRDLNATRVLSSGRRNEIENEMLVRTLKELSETDPDYWTFRRDSLRAGTHGLSQYPAMMVPKMLEGLFKAIRTATQEPLSVLDPFVGSGTTLVESLRVGFDFTGQDINPLAVLLCQVKAGPFAVEKLKRSQAELLSRVRADRKRSIEASFEGLSKWFATEVAIALSRIRRSIRQEENKWVRRVFWVVMAETVRLTSNSRTSTFKMHIRSMEDLRSREFSTIEVFSRVLQNVVERLAIEATRLREGNFLSRSGSYRASIQIHLMDSSSAPSIRRSPQYDLLVTSPPYGDNTSTVPYGQYSFLPLQWIDLKDISESIDPEMIRTAYEIDSRSLGGVRKYALDRAHGLMQVSPSIKAILRQLEGQPRDRAARVAAFCVDLDRSLERIHESMKHGALMVWITGNRRVGGLSVPLDDILVELLEARGATFLHRIRRRIPSKRMATRNNVSTTMREENIQILRSR